MKTAGTVIAIAVICAAVFGVLASREYAASQRTATEIRANADISIARIEADADIEESRQATQRTALWTQVAPIVALIVVVGVGAWIVLWWRGRLYLAQVEAPRRPAQLAPPPEVVQLADARQGRPVLIDGVWHVERGGQLIARLRELPDRSRM